MFSRLIIALCVSLCLAFTTGCEPTPTPPETSSRDGQIPQSEIPSEMSEEPLEIDSILPSLEGYRVLSLSQGRAIFTTVATIAVPEYRKALEGGDAFIACYENNNALAGRGYLNSELMHSGGVVGILDREKAADPNLLAQCTVSALLDAVIPLDADETDISPCGNVYTTIISNREYSITYAGTTLAFCRDVCRDLPDCNKH